MKGYFVMKKIVGCILMLATLLLTACATSATPTATPEPTAKPGLAVSALSDYTIVYPSDYTEYRMQEVYLLQSVIKTLSGKEPSLASDREDAVSKEIIIGSSARKNNYSADISAFESGLDYIIAADNDKIVLGGNNFYADMRAIYDFINNYLGYDDIENKYEEPSMAIYGVQKNIYREPSLRIMGSNFSVSPYTEQYAVRDMHDAHFNMTNIEAVAYTEEQLRDFIKWCARYEIFLIMRDVLYTDVYIDCPIIWGHSVDEPRLEAYESVSQWCKEYEEKYSKYGWKTDINFVGIFSPREDWYEEYCEAYEKNFSNLFSFSYDWYLGNMDNCRDEPVCGVLEDSKKHADKYGQEFWYYIDSFWLDEGQIQNTYKNSSKMFRTHSYMALSYDADCIRYFQYGDATGNGTYGTLVNFDYSKNKHYYIAQQVNEELLKISEILQEYEWLGACTLSDEDEEIFSKLNDPYDFSNVITDFEQVIYEDTHLVGCFKKKDGSGYAFTLVNIEPLDMIPYDNILSYPAKMKINGNNVKFYKDGKITDIKQDSDGYYNFSTGNGYCWLVTVD